ncbi:hypothetical protein B0T19DRAFT_272356 [Cercophora scortea]|uniref:Uncharacterized protein n=1 Tax=Cercophora scortea TaxID=314031 RepID=A0AAE0I7C2_9PEZI|nr:hypothetical protein B0T19DRAFT_272356 [Cercophora scortea]
MGALRSWSLVLAVRGPWFACLLSRSADGEWMVDFQVWAGWLACWLAGWRWRRSKNLGAWRWTLGWAGSGSTVATRRESVVRFGRGANLSVRRLPLFWPRSIQWSVNGIKED